VIKWLQSLLGLVEEDASPQEPSITSKLRGIENMKRLNDLVLSGECSHEQLTELELGAETISLNLKKQDTEKLKQRGGAV